MKVLIIGHSVVDLFNTVNGVIEKPGGIFYTVTGISLCKQEKDKIFLLSLMEKEKKELFQNAFKYVDQSYIKISDSIPRVNLTLCRNNERGEKYSNIEAKLNIDLILDHNTFDGILLNMISGFDINLDDLKSIRRKYKGEIYFDVHTLSRGLDEQNNRKFRPVPNADQWLGCVDIVQVNEGELLTITNGGTEFDRVDEVLNNRPHTLIITMGSKGVKMYYKKKNKIEKKFLPPISVDSINQVGCGDVFGAVFFYSYISNRNRHKSLEIANTAAGVITAYDDFNNIELIKNDFLERLG